MKRKFLTHTGTDILYRTRSRRKNRKFGRHLGHRWMLGYAHLVEIERFLEFVDADPMRFRKRLRAPEGTKLSAELADAISGSEKFELVHQFWSFAFVFPEDIEDPDILGGFVAGAIDAWNETIAGLSPPAHVPVEWSPSPADPITPFDVCKGPDSIPKSCRYYWRLGHRWMEAHVTLEKVIRFIRFVGDPEQFSVRLRGADGTQSARAMFNEISGFQYDGDYRCHEFWANAFHLPDDLDDLEFVDAFVQGGMSRWNETLNRLNVPKQPDESAAPTSTAAAPEIPWIIVKAEFGRRRAPPMNWETLNAMNYPGPRPGVVRNAGHAAFGSRKLRAR